MGLILNPWYASQSDAFPLADLDALSMAARPLTLRFDYPLPYGAIVHDGGVQFVVFSRSATAMRVLLYDDVDDRDPSEVVDFDPDLNRWGDVWSVFVPGH